MLKKETIRLYPSQRLDEQHRELLRIFVERDPRVNSVPLTLSAADIIAVHVLELADIKPHHFPTKYVLVLDFGDLYKRKIGVRQEDEEYRQAVRDAGKTYIYLQGESNPSLPVMNYGDPPIFTETYKVDDPNFIQLSIPLGYCSGAKMNLSYPDYDQSAYFIDNLQRNPKNYLYDFCWIGAESSLTRKSVLQELYKTYSGNGLWTNILGNDLTTNSLPALMPHMNKILIKSGMPISRKFETRLKELNADNKTVPYDQYLDFHRESKVNISCNGFSKWNYMDGEYFSRNCFNLRQYHKDLDKNPFSPKDGMHWVVFKEDELLDKLNYYIEHDEERERINDAGFEYFKDAISGGWAKQYVDMLLSYLETGKREVFKSVL